MNKPTSDAANKPKKHGKGKAAKATPEEDERVKHEREQEAQLTQYAAGLDVSQFGEMTLDDVAKVLSLTIKDDDNNKKIVFLAMLSAYTEKSQINITLNAPSSAGKTYLASEIAGLFPKKDKVERSGASPTSFFYGEGTIDKKRNAKIVSLERKILIFYEQPNPVLQEKLRALLSKDAKELTHSLVNRNKGRNQTDEIIIRGFSATIFCSANMKLDEQETTRAILVSPEATEEKIRHAIKQRIKRGKNEAEFDIWLRDRPERISLMNRIVAIRDEHVNEIIISDADAETIEKDFFDMIKKPKYSNQRHIGHLLELIRVIAPLNVWRRRQPDGSVVANHSDIAQAFALWGDYFESQNLGIAPAVLSIYKKYIVPAYIAKFRYASGKDKEAITKGEIGLTSQELSVYYFQEEETMLNNDTLRKQILPQLESANLISLEKPKIVKESYSQWDYDRKSEPDRRTRHIFPKLLTDEEKKYIGLGGVGNTDESEPGSPRSGLQELLDEIPD